MDVKLVNKSHILLMKAGPYCGYDLDEIIEIKQNEEKSIGKFYWGYGGVFCRPKTIIPFVSHARLDGKLPHVYFTTTSSKYETPNEGRFNEYSYDNINWFPLPKEVLLVGNVKSPHFAIIGHKLQLIDATINLSDYCTFRGILPDPQKQLSDYFRYRVDKACGLYKPNDDKEKKIVSISFKCVLTEPYCVYIRRH